MEKTPGQRIALTKFERSICSRERLAEFSIFHSFGVFFREIVGSLQVRATSREKKAEKCMEN